MSMPLRSVLPLLLLPAIASAAPQRTPQHTPQHVQQHLFGLVAVSPDGTTVAALEATEPADPAADPAWSIRLHPVAGGISTGTTLPLPCSGNACVPSSIAWAPDGKHIAFVLREPKQTHRVVFVVPTEGGPAVKALDFDGTLQDLRYGHDGTLAVLATAGAHKEPGATQAAAKLSGEIGVEEDEQRIGLIADNKLEFQSPADLYVYEYDWQPDPTQPGRHRFVATAAHGNGDNNWWTARLVAVENGNARVLYTPPQKQQLADPVVSPDGKAVAFVGGLMSDFGSTGGDAFRLSLDGPANAQPVLQNLSPNLRGSVTDLSWRCSADPAVPGLVATVLAGANTELLPLVGGGDPSRPMFSAPVSLSGPTRGLGIACGGGVAAAVQQDFTTAPELVAGPVGRFHPLTRENDGPKPAVDARSITWRSDQFEVQGWLLSPKSLPNDMGGAKSPMIVSIHGGPAAANEPRFLHDRDLTLFLLQAGYRVFLPNPRGSFGQGEAFTQGNVRDFGHGDLRDILSGIDAVERTVPVDDKRLGIMGYSYGGYMTMWTVTQTNRFHAAVAGAGISDWQSYYGENGIDQWMIPFFGASVYDDPQIYARSSPITFIRQVKTPTFAFVGDADVECPLPQTQEFIHALRTFGVPNEFVVYPGQGHGMRDPADWADAKKRSLAWFDRYLRVN